MDETAVPSPSHQPTCDYRISVIGISVLRVESYRLQFPRSIVDPQNRLVKEKSRTVRQNNKMECWHVVFESVMRDEVYVIGQL